MNLDAGELELAEAASRLKKQDLAWIEENSQDLKSQELSSQEESSQEESTQEEAGYGIFSGSADNAKKESQPGKKRTRRSVKHQWPEVGAVLKADYEGTRYEVEVIASPKYKSGKALLILNGPAEGGVVSSMSAAMLLATDKQRKENNLGRKGVSNGWGFWQVKK